jgi:hypothetical protein
MSPFGAVKFGIAGFISFNIPLGFGHKGAAFGMCFSAK